MNFLVVAFNKWALIHYIIVFDSVRSSGGVRKVKRASLGKGKCGGICAIYYWKKAEHEIWMFTLYSKSELSTIFFTLRIYTVVPMKY